MKREFAYIEPTDSGRFVIKHRESDAVIDTFDDKETAELALAQIHERFRGFANVIDEIQFAIAKGDELPTETLRDVRIFSVGRWRDSQGRPFNATPKVLENLLESWKEFGRDRVKPHLKHMHIQNPFVHKNITGLVRLGFISNLRIKGKDLVCDLLKVPRVVAKLIKAGTLGRPSAEIAEKFTDRNTGKTFPHMLMAAVTTGAGLPAVNTLPEMVKLFGKTPDDVKEFAAVTDAPFTSFTDPSVGDVVVMSFIDATLTDESIEPTQPKGGEIMPKEKTEREIVLETTVNENTKKFADINAALGIDPNADPVTAITSLNNRVTALESAAAESAKADFDAKIDAIIAKHQRFTDANGKVVGKVRPADIPMIKTLVDGFVSKADDNGVLTFEAGETEKTGTVFDALEMYFANAPVVVSYDESGKVVDPKKPDDKTGESKFIDDDVKRFAEEKSESGDTVIVEDFDESAVRDYMRNNNCSYQVAFAAVVPGAAMVADPKGFPAGAEGNA